MAVKAILSIVGICNDIKLKVGEWAYCSVYTGNFRGRHAAKTVLKLKIRKIFAYEGSLDVLKIYGTSNQFMYYGEDFEVMPSDVMKYCYVGTWRAA